MRRGANARAQTSGSQPSAVAVFSNICRYASTSSWVVILGSSCAACTRGPVTERAGGRAMRRAVTSSSTWPWRAARCSTICCWRRLTSVSWRSSFSILWGGVPLFLQTKQRKREDRETTGGDHLLVNFLNLPAFSTSVAGWKNHATRRAPNKYPGGWIY